MIFLRNFIVEVIILLIRVVGFVNLFDCFFQLLE